MGRSRSEAERALARLTLLLADLGLQPKVAKTRIAHLTVGGEGLTSSASTVGWYAPVDKVVREINTFLRGWSGYFRNSARSFDRISAFASRGSPASGQVSQAPIPLGLATGGLRVTRPTGTDQTQRDRRRTQALWGPQAPTEHRRWHRSAVSGEPHARFERLETKRGHVTAPALDPTTIASAPAPGQLPRRSRTSNGSRAILVARWLLNGVPGGQDPHPSQESKRHQTLDGSRCWRMIVSPLPGGSTAWLVASASSCSRPPTVGAWFSRLRVLYPATREARAAKRG